MLITGSLWSWLTLIPIPTAGETSVSVQDITIHQSNSSNVNFLLMPTLVSMDREKLKGGTVIDTENNSFLKHPFKSNTVQHWSECNYEQVLSFNWSTAGQITFNIASHLEPRATKTRAQIERASFCRHKQTTKQAFWLPHCALQQ